MKLSLVFVAMLLFASCGKAQIVTHNSTSNSGNGYSVSLGGGAWSGFTSSMGRAVMFEPPRQYFVESAKNDGPFVPSTYMNYEDALALGRQQLAAQEAESRGEGVSLGELARAYRSEKAPTFRLRSRFAQDSAGNLQICNLNGNDCRKL